MSEPRAGGYREPLAGESLDEYEAALAAAEDKVVAAIWRATLRGALADAQATPPGTEPTDPTATRPGTEPTDPTATPTAGI